MQQFGQDAAGPKDKPQPQGRVALDADDDLRRPRRSPWLRREAGQRPAGRGSPTPRPRPPVTSGKIDGHRAQLGLVRQTAAMSLHDHRGTQLVSSRPARPHRHRLAERADRGISRPKGGERLLAGSVRQAWLSGTRSPQGISRASGPPLALELLAALRAYRAACPMQEKASSMPWSGMMLLATSISRIRFGRAFRQVGDHVTGQVRGRANIQHGLSRRVVAGRLHLGSGKFTISAARVAGLLQQW